MTEFEQAAEAFRQRWGIDPVPLIEQVTRDGGWDVEGGGEDERAFIRYIMALKGAELRWQDGDRPPQVTAVAEVLGLDPDKLWEHVEGIHGWEPHDEGYEDAVWAAAECTEHGVNGKAAKS